MKMLMTAGALMLGLGAMPVASAHACPGDDKDPSVCPGDDKDPSACPGDDKDPSACPGDDKDPS